MKLFSQSTMKKLLYFLPVLLCSSNLISQTTLTTNFTNNNGFSLVTFNFANNNPGDILITDISSVCGSSGSMPVAAYYKTSAINGAPGPISQANGWIQFGSATINAIANTTTSTPQLFMSGLSLLVPAGSTYGLAVQATSLRYSTLPASPANPTVTGGGCIITTGANIGFGGGASPSAPVISPRGFIGSITFINAIPCAGIPAPGNTIATANPVCPGINFSLSVQNATQGTGVSYQWQQSSDGITWANIPGANNAAYATSQTNSTYYRCNVTCSGNTTVSGPLLVNITPASGCFCNPPPTNCNLDDVILNVTAGGINNNSLCGLDGYSDFTAAVPAGSVAAGLNMPMSVTVGPGGIEYVGVWIDYDHSGTFEASEFTLLGSGNGVTISGNVQIPALATLGNTRMRVRVRFGTALTGANACAAYTYGETEDYLMNITPCIVGSVSTQPVNTTSYCSGNATIKVVATGTALTYQWQERVNSTAPWTIISNGGIYSGATSPTLSLSNLLSTSNGHQFQVAIGGPCTPTFLSSVATLTVGPLVANVNPSSATICNGAIRQLSITTTAPPATASFSSGPLTFAIPDNTANGVNHTINVSTIPAGAIITAMTVKFNLAHTYCGDMIINLKAPNGNILALDKYLTGTASQAGTYPNVGFVNTLISSTGTVALGTAAAQPITGTFRADAINAPLGATVENPAGFVSNAANFAALYSVPNGAWTLALADGGAADVGTLNNWSMDITYGAPFSGIWAPAATLYTDAAAMVPYIAGTLANTVYAMPTTTTNYTVTISTANCTSPVTTIPVIVANAIGTVTAPSNKSICINSNTSFTASAATGNPITYQWQVSTDAGSTWANIANGGVYSGATTGTLSLTNVPDTFNNYRYRAVLTVAACTSTITSGSATLKVNALPVISLTAAPYTELYPGRSTVISAGVSPNATTYQWYKDGILIPGATGTTLSVDVDSMGDYSVMVTDVNGCSNSSASLTISEAANDKLFIYPNPNPGQFQVRYYNLVGNATNPRTLNIFDSKGALVYSKTYNITEPYSKMEVDMSNYSKGIYRVELGDRNGNRIKTGSVIIL